MTDSASIEPVVWIGNAGILETVENHAGDTYGALYTVRSASRIYVLHTFQKKSKTGIKTPKAGIAIFRSRPKRAEEEHARWLKAQKE